MKQQPNTSAQFFFCICALIITILAVAYGAHQRAAAKKAEWQNRQFQELFLHENQGRKPIE